MVDRTIEQSPGRQFLKFAILGFFVAHVWEILQMPFFEPGGLSPTERTWRCTIASVGDGLILGSAAWLAGKISTHADWSRTLAVKPVLTYFGFGLIVAIGVEIVATTLPERSMLSWRYGANMPMIPGTSLALVPLAMWIIVPAITLWLSRFTRE